MNLNKTLADFCGKNLPETEFNDASRNLVIFLKTLLEIAQERKENE